MNQGELVCVALSVGSQTFDVRLPRALLLGARGPLRILLDLEDCSETVTLDLPGLPSVRFADPCELLAACLRDELPEAVRFAPPDSQSCSRLVEFAAWTHKYGESVAFAQALSAWARFWRERRLLGLDDETVGLLQLSLDEVHELLHKHAELLGVRLWQAEGSTHMTCCVADPRTAVRASTSPSGFFDSYEDLASRENDVLAQEEARAALAWVRQQLRQETAVDRTVATWLRQQEDMAESSVLLTPPLLHDARLMEKHHAGRQKTIRGQASPPPNSHGLRLRLLPSDGQPVLLRRDPCPALQAPGLRGGHEAAAQKALRRGRHGVEDADAGATVR
jgi:hypothetical protein